MRLAMAGIGVLSVALLAGGAYYAMHQRETRPQPALASGRETASAPPVVNTAPAGDAKGFAARSAGKADPNRAAALEPQRGLTLRTGEILDYTADVAKVSNVATLRLQVAERRNLVGKSAWHLQAFAHTQNPLRMVFELDDQFDSYSDAGTLASLQYEM